MAHHSQPASGVRCPNPACPDDPVRQRVDTIVISPESGDDGSILETLRAYWAGVLAGALLWITLAVLLWRWLSALAARADPSAPLLAILLGAWVLAAVAGSVHFMRIYRRSYRHGRRASRFHFVCARCRYAWSQLDMTPDVAEHEAQWLAAGLARWRRYGLRAPVAYLLVRLASALRYAGRLGETRPLLEESLGLLRAEKDQALRLHAQLGLGYAALGEEDLTRANQAFEQALDLAMALSDWAGIAAARAGLGTALLCQGHLDEARAHGQGSLALSVRLGDRDGIARNLETLAGVAAEHDPQRAARLAGAAEALRQACGVPQPADGRPCYGRTQATLAARLGEEEMARARYEGSALGPEDILSLAAWPPPR